jgi:long-subunit acyl-CoA synthetase (AMP-forming)
LVTGGAPTSKEVKTWARGLFPEANFQDSYGTTECGGISSDGRRLVKKGVEVALVDVPHLGFTSEDKPFPRGEIVALTPNLTLGYLKMAAQEREVFIDAGPEDSPANPDGSPIHPPLKQEIWSIGSDDDPPYRWYRTGDLGMIDNTGQLHILERISSVVSDASNHIFTPNKLETIFEVHPFVSSIFVDVEPTYRGAVAVVVPELEPAAAAGLLPTDVVGNVLSDGTALEANLLESWRELARQHGTHENEVPYAVVFAAQPWTVENGMLNGSHKKVRKALKAEYSSALQAVRGRPSESWRAL